MKVIRRTTIVTIITIAAVSPALAATPTAMPHTMKHDAMKHTTMMKHTTVMKHTTMKMDHNMKMTHPTPTKTK